MTKDKQVHKKEVQDKKKRYEWSSYTNYDPFIQNNVRLLVSKFNFSCYSVSR